MNSAGFAATGTCLWLSREPHPDGFVESCCSELRLGAHCWLVCVCLLANSEINIL